MNTSVTETFESILEAQNQACTQLSKILTNVKKKGEGNFTLPFLESRLKMYQETWQQIRQANGYLQAARKADRTKEDLPYFKAGTMDRVEDAYLDGWAYLRQHIESLSAPVTSPTANSTLELPTPPVSLNRYVKLPKVEIPTFEGDFAKWKSFEARFTSAILRNESLTDSVRMEYLLGCLSGEALAIVDNLDVVDSSFQIAWDRLREIYDNERVVVHVLLQKLYSLKPIKLEQLDTLKQFTIHFRNTLEALHKLGRNSEEDHLVFLVSSRFDHDMTLEWRKHLGNSRKYPSYKTLEEFMITQTASVEVTGLPKQQLVPPAKSTEKWRQRSTTHVIEGSASTRPTCLCCPGSHSVRECNDFNRLTPLARFDLLKNKQVCINCLSAEHTVSKCPSTHDCRECGGRHHTLLHRGEKMGRQARGYRKPARTYRDSRKDSTPPTTHATTVSSMKTEERPSTSLETCNNVATHYIEAVPNGGKTVLLATALVNVYAGDGRSRLARALLDPGSQSSFVSTTLAQHLRLQKIRSPISVTGLGGGHASNIDYSALISIGHAGASKPIVSTHAFIVRNISKYVPPPICVDGYGAFGNLALADPTPESSQRIDLLLGAEVCADIIRPQIRRGRKGEPVAQNTDFGWILYGQLNDATVHRIATTSHHGAIGDPLEKALSRFWETESVPETRSLTPQEQRCEQHFTETYTRDATGRFIVRLPFITSVAADHLGDSFRGASASLKRLTLKLQRNGEVKREYTNFLREYETLEHMTLLPSIDKTRTYIPHRAVIREDSLTTKLRVVFNASNKTASGYSLNDLLHAGPKLQRDISKILLDWRLHQYVLVADVEKMFRQVRVHPDDRKFQCILWENETNNKLEAYELNTITYGTACAPYLSMRVIQELNRLDGANFPLAFPVLANSVYVDDVFIGAPDKQILEQTRKQVCELLGRGGFHLRKWAGNDPGILRNIPATKHSLAIDLRIFDESELKVLGIKWTPSDDTFTFDLQRFTTSEVRMTKRELLSDIAKLFDPLGWLSPIIIRAKILMQQQWLEKVEWDERVSETTQATWNAFCTDWRALNTLRIPRWIHHGPDTIDIQLHGFSDASRAAFSCAVYARVRSLNGDTHTTLLVAKSRVAPIKTLSIPILELSGAVMLTELLDHVTKSIGISAQRIICWTDSTIVLAWLQKHPSTWKTTIANRTSKIHTTVPTATWKHVPTRFNPADLNSRGVNAADLLTSDFWLKGPAWLRESEECWPPQQVYSTEEGQRGTTVHMTTSDEQWDALSRISSWPRLIRVFGYIRRFIDRTRAKTKFLHLYLTVPELREAERALCRTIQTTSFSSEIKAIAGSRTLETRSKLVRLNPFLDQYGILRVGGRLQNSFLPWETKHPIILPKNYVSELIIGDSHLRTLHGGTQLTVYTTRQKYWILSIRDTARRVINRCVKCTRWRAETATQIMQNLVPSRCRPSPPFSNVGIDYAGPYQVREAAGRGKKTHKTYIAVFICLATRAIHLELVHDYSTDAFLAAFDRFASRRGVPATITSDNGTNFVGAARVVARDFAAVTESPEFKDRCADLHIEWSFYPPGAPHHGGMQEAAVRSVKHHLRRIIGSFTPTAEEMSTLLCKIEGTLNSRPITRVRDDPDCLEILTPGHFLTGGPLNTRPTPSVTEPPISHLSRWQTIQKFHELLWKTWSREYLQELQSRYKWNIVKAQIKEDDIVLIENPLLPPNRWEMGRITKTYPGKDNNVRVVDVQTQNSVYRRPITRICSLPVA